MHKREVVTQGGKRLQCEARPCSGDESPEHQQPPAELGQEEPGVEPCSTPTAVPGRCQVRVYAHSSPEAGIEPCCIPAVVLGHCQKARRIPPAPGRTAALDSPTHHQSLPRTHLKAVPGSQAPMAESAKHTRGSPPPPGAQK